MIAPPSPIATSVLPFWTTTADAGADATAYLNFGALLSSTCNFRNASAPALRRLRHSISDPTISPGKQMRRGSGDGHRESWHRPRTAGTVGLRLDRLEAQRRVQADACPSDVEPR